MTEEEKVKAQAQAEQAVEPAEAAAEQAQQESAKQESVKQEVPSPDDQLAALFEQLEDLKEQNLRIHAEAQNVKRRAEQDVSKARKFALEKIVSDLLPVVDNLERALAALNGDEDAQKAAVEGIELTYKSFVDTLKKHNVEQVYPVGEPFNPELHQAMTQVPNPDMEPNTVMEVFQKGYTLNGRLVRPAMVVVSKSV